MPCDSAGYPQIGTDYSARTAADGLKKELDAVTSMLCSLLRQLDGRIPLPPDIADWFVKHKAWDKSQGRLF